MFLRFCTGSGSLPIKGEETWKFKVQRGSEGMYHHKLRFIVIDFFTSFLYAVTLSVVCCLLSAVCCFLLFIPVCCLLFACLFSFVLPLLCLATYLLFPP